MATIKYHAKANFDIETEIDVDDPNDAIAIWLAIIDDLEDRYRLEIQYERVSNEEGV